MRKLTPVTTSSMRDERGSITNENPILLAEAVIQSNKLTVMLACVSFRCQKRAQEIRNDISTVPQAKRDVRLLGRRLKFNPMIKNERRGKTGTNTAAVFILLIDSIG